MTTTTNKRKKRGLFITFEGCDRAGKSTQVEMLNTMLNEQGIPCIKIAFPCYDTPVGKLIKEKLQSGGNGVEMHLLFVANRYEFQKRIKNYLNDGINILCDRYKDSGRAYGLATGIPDKWLVKCDSVNIDPDYVIYIDVDAEIASKRTDYGDGGIYERVSFQKTVREHYRSIANDNWICVDGNTNNVLNIHLDIVDNAFKVFGFFLE